MGGNWCWLLDGSSDGFFYLHVASPCGLSFLQQDSWVRRGRVQRASLLRTLRKSCRVSNDVALGIISWLRLTHRSSQIQGVGTPWGLKMKKHISSGPSLEINSVPLGHATGEG